MASLRSMTARRAVWKIARDSRNSFAALTLLGLSLSGVGCSQLPRVSQLPQELGMVSAPPATQIAPLWEPRLASLPNPLQDGRLMPGLVGQLYLITAGNQPAKVNGDLVVMLSDQLPAQNGQGQPRTEYYHFDSVALKKLVSHDERFGTCVMLFLPWPADWTDVTAVHIQAKYTQKNAPDLYSGDMPLALDFSGPGTPVWSNVGDGKNPAGSVAGPPRNAFRPTMGIPDIAKILQAGATTTTKAEKPAAHTPAVQQTSVNLPQPGQPAVATPASPPQAAMPVVPTLPVAPPLLTPEANISPATPLPVPRIVTGEKSVLAVPPIPVAPPVIEPGPVPPLPGNGR